MFCSTTINYLAWRCCETVAVLWTNPEFFTALDFSAGAVLSSYGREYAAEPYLGHTIGPAHVTGYGVSI